MCIGPVNPLWPPRPVFSLDKRWKTAIFGVWLWLQYLHLSAEITRCMLHLCDLVNPSTLSSFGINVCGQCGVCGPHSGDFLWVFLSPFSVFVCCLSLLYVLCCVFMRVPRYSGYYICPSVISTVRSSFLVSCVCVCVCVCGVCVRVRVRVCMSVWMCAWVGADEPNQIPFYSCHWCLAWRPLEERSKLWTAILNVIMT